MPKPPIGRFAGTKWTSLNCLAWLRNVAEQVHGVRAAGAWCDDESAAFSLARNAATVRPDAVAANGNNVAGPGLWWQRNR